MYGTLLYNWITMRVILLTILIFTMSKVDQIMITKVHNSSGILHFNFGETHIVNEILIFLHEMNLQEMETTVNNLTYT